MEELLEIIGTLTESQEKEITEFFRQYVITERTPHCTCDCCRPGTGYDGNLNNGTYIVCLNCTSYCDVCGEVPMAHGYTRCYFCNQSW